MSQQSPLVSAIILYYDPKGAEEAKECINALQQQTIAAQMEMIVVDNHSPEATYEDMKNHCAGHTNISLIRTPANLGYGGGNNVGARMARGEYLLILNPDSHPTPSAIEILVQTLQNDQSIGIVGPKLLFEDGSLRESHRDFPAFLPMIMRRLQAPSPVTSNGGQPQKVDWLVGACLCLQRSLYQELDGFDERFFLFFEDIDLCRRCTQKGKSVVYVPQSVVRDRKERLSGQGIGPLLTTKVGRIHIASFLKYFWKWRGGKLLEK